MNIPLTRIISNEIRIVRVLIPGVPGPGGGPPGPPGPEGPQGPPGPAGPQLVVQTMAALKAASLSLGVYVETLGYFSPGDGGGGVYQIVAPGTGTADDAFFANLTNGNQAKLQLPDPARIHVRQLGALADGVADDSARIAIGESNPAIGFVDLGGLNVKTTLVLGTGPAQLVNQYYNGRINGLSSTTAAQTFLKEEISTRDTALIRDRFKSPILDWPDREVLWVGTSLANQGANIDSYGLIACQCLGAKLTNMAWPGTGATYNPLDDPMNINTSKSLSMTEDDRIWGAGLPTAHPNAYEDAFDPQNKASEMTVDFRIRNVFQAKAVSVMVLDHNHNDRGSPIGTLNPESHPITAITKGATTGVQVSALGTLAIGDAVAIEVAGIGNLHHFAGRVQAIAGTVITLNIDSTAFAGAFTSGTLYKLDRDAISGAWEFLIHYTLNCSIRFGDGGVKIILVNAPSEFSHATDDGLFFPCSETIKSVARKWGLSFFDIAWYYEMTLQDQNTYFGDDVHPNTTARRAALAYHWIRWMSGGATPSKPLDFWLRTGSDKNYLDQAPVFFSKYIGGFGTIKQAIISESIVYQDTFATLDAGWSVQGTAPVIAAAPWGTGQALHCTAPANGASGFTRNITIGNGRKVEMDLWFPKVTGFAGPPVNELISLWTFLSGGGSGYINFRANVRTAQTTFLGRYFKTPGTTLTTMAPAPTKNLAANTKYRLRCEMYKGLSATNLGSFVIYLDNVLIGGPYAIEDFGQTAITTLQIGAIASTLGDVFEVWIGNLVVSALDVRDMSSLYTGDVAVTGGTLKVVKGMVTALV